MTKRFLYFTACIALLLSLSGCADISPKFVDGVTPPPEISAAPEPTPSSEPPEETELPEETVAPDDALQKDAFGNIVYGSDHFERYITFKNIEVYEENGDTFVDCTVENTYPTIMFCAVNIAFYNEDGAVIASSSLQMPDGSFMLSLASGENTLYARVLTDTRLTDKEFTLSFDPQTGVKPQ